MFVRIGGHGPAVLLLHGCPSSADELLPIAAHLAATHRIVVPDLPGYAWSRHVTPTTVTKTRTVLLQVLQQAGITRLHAAIGYSAGAYRALDLACSGELPVERLGLLGGFADLTREHRDEFLALATFLEPLPTFDAATRALVVDRVTSPGWRAREQHRVPEVARVLDATTPRAMAAELRALAEAPSLLDRARLYSGQAFVRVGELDEAMPPRYSAAVAEALRVPVEVVRGVGHALLFEDEHDTVARIVALAET